jgi:hypothetical protein
VPKAWLAKFSWEAVTAINAQLCETKSALHKPTSDGHDEARALWESNHRKEMSWEDAVHLCRKCHKIAPFCFFNGNTFAAISKIALKGAEGLTVMDRHFLESISAHIVAGTETSEETQQFRTLLQKVDG